MHNNQPQSESNDSREIRVFLSSTFKDMDEERNILMQQVFPELRLICAERAVALTEIDLRWGVTEEASKNGQTVEICLQEIDHCRQFPPFFLGFLGERYGWIPQHEELQAYWEKHPDSPYAQRIQQALEEGISVTELEMRYGIWEGGVGSENARVFLRDPQLTERLAAGCPRDYYYNVGDKGNENKTAGGKLVAFKELLREQPGLVAVDGYTRIEAFAEAVKETLLQAIDQRYPKEQVPSLQEVHDRAHRAYAQSRLRAYVPDPQIDQRIDVYLQGHGSAPVMERRVHIQGVSGLGKSALLAHTAQRLRGQGYWVHEHYVGADGDRSLAGWRERLVAVLSAGSTETEAEFQMGQQKDPWEALDRALAQRQAQLQKPMVLLLDALDQLDELGEALAILSQRILPLQVFLLHSATPDVEISLPVSQCIELSPMGVAQREKAIVRFLEETYRKSLDAPQIQRLSQAEACGNPLFLRLLLEELRLHARFETLNEVIDSLLATGTVGALFEQVLAAMDQDFHTPGYSRLARDLVRYLTLSYRGLHKNDLAVLLGAEEERLADARLIPLLARLDAYLLRDAGRLRLLHAALREPLDQTLNADEAGTQALRRRMMTRLDGADLDQRIERIHQAVVLGDRAMLLGEAGLRDLAATESIQKEAPTLLVTALRGLGAESGSDARKSPELARLAQDWARAIQSADGANDANELAEWLDDQELDPLVLPLYKRILTLREEVLGREHVDVADSLINLGQLYNRLSFTGDSVPLYKRALVILEQAPEPENYKMAKALNNVAILYKSNGEHDDAELLFRSSLVLVEKAVGPDHPDVAVVLSNLAGLYQSQGRYAEAESLFQRSLKILEKIPGLEHINKRVDILNNLASIYEAQNDYFRTEQCLQQSLEILKNTFGFESPGEATALNKLASIYEAQNDYCNAEQCLQQSLKVLENISGIEYLNERVSTLNNLAKLYQLQVHFDEAKRTYHHALALQENFVSLFNLASLYYDLQNYAEAEPLYQQAFLVGKRRQAFGVDNDSDYANILNKLKTIHAAKEKSLGPEDPAIASSLENLAHLFLKRSGDWQNDAKPFYERALAIWEKTPGPERTDIAASLENMAKLYLDWGSPCEHLDEADRLYERALAIREKTLGPEHLDIAASLENRAKLYYNTCVDSDVYAIAKCLHLYERALAIWEKKTSFPNNPKVAAIREKLSSLYQRQKEEQEYLDFYQDVGHGEDCPYDDFWHLPPGEFSSWEEYNDLYQNAIAVMEKSLGSNDPRLADGLVLLGRRLYKSMGKPGQALPLLERAREIFSGHAEATEKAKEVEELIAEIKSRD